jgi:glycosyltransferase involved in cell wall biosynthesis
MTARPKVLYLSAYDPDGVDNGGTLRNRHLLGHLNQIGDVSVLLATDFENQTARPKKTTAGLQLLNVLQFQPTPGWSLAERWRNEFDGRFLNTDRVLATRSDRGYLQAQMAAHDVTWVHTLKLANRFDLWRWPNSVLDVDDIPSRLNATHAAAAEKPVEKFRHWRQGRLWRRREKFLTERFDAICVCSEPDRRQLGSREIYVLPNGFSAPKKTPPRHPANPPRVGFIGNFGHAPNANGMDWFLKNVWPAILQTYPQARLRLIGAGGEIFQRHKNTDVLGWLADVEAEMADWTLTVVPVLFGGGTRVKIAEAFSRQCPVVSTYQGAYGYEVENGQELLLADSAREFTAKCLWLLDHPAEAKALADRAWHQFLQNWTWDAQAGRVREIVETVLNKNGQEKHIRPPVGV